MDSSLKFLFISFTVTFLLTLNFAQEEFLDYSCMETGGNFTRNSTYETNIDRLRLSFSSNTADDYGFYNISSGVGSERVNSVALCRGDVGSADCLGCINNAMAELRSLCPNQREAIIWYDNCMFRYTNRSIFGVVEDDPLVYMWNENNVTDVDAFNRSLSALLDSLRNSASLGLPVVECNSCLSAAIEFIPECCDRKQGGRVLEPSCNFRFEIERFYNLTMADTPLPSAPPRHLRPRTTPRIQQEKGTIRLGLLPLQRFRLLLLRHSLFPVASYSF
ncbi:Cysteine-rich RLK 10 [Hibiscus syriacus]|uniref:Cysteine-rich RLK 10 n=1 Tax=Hibiscus syriacus TaxID=106335 RepID=A0A6A2ZCK0_HIBSY|nr:Cysteine-rich RLK 10 [Hibiscus syriacus]